MAAAGTEAGALRLASWAPPGAWAPALGPTVTPGTRLWRGARCLGTGRPQPERPRRLGARYFGPGASPLVAAAQISRSSTTFLEPHG